MNDPNPKTTWQPSDFFYVLGLVAAAGLAFLPLILDHQSFYRPALFGNDFKGAYVQGSIWLGYILRRGYFPLWVSYYNSGTPLLALIQGSFGYPFSIFYSWFSFTAAHALLLVGHLTLVGIFTFVTFRYLRLSAPAAFLASLWIMLSGPLLWCAFFLCSLQEYPWFILLYLGAVMALRERSFRAWLMVAVAFCLELSGGDPETVVYSGLLVAAAVVLHVGWERIPWREAAHAVLLLAAGLVGGGLISGYQGLTTLEFFSHCIRSTPLDYQTYLEGWASGREYLNLFLPLLRRQTGELFFGLLPLGLFLVGLSRQANRTARGISAALVGLGLALTFSPFLHLTPLLYRLPLFSLFYRHYKMLPGFQFFLCLGIAAGADVLLAQPRRRLWLGIIGLGLLDLALPARPWAFKLAVLAGYLLALAAAGKRFRPRRLALALIFISLMDLLSKLWGTPYRLELPQFADSFHRFFAQADPQARTVVLYRLDELFHDSEIPIPLNSGFWDHTSGFDCWFNIPLTRYLLFLSRLNPQIVRFREGKLVQSYMSSAFKHLDFVTPQNRHLVDYLALRYFVTYRFPLASADQPGNNFQRRVHDDVDIYENLQALPRAFLVHGVRHYDDDGRLLTDLGLADRFQPRGQVLLLGPGPDQLPAPAGPQEKVELLDYQDQIMQYQVSLLSPGYLSTSENYFPGWRAWVNGREAPVLRANFTFRALALPEGSSSVVFRYAPLSFRIGLWVTAASLLFFLVGGLWYGSRGWFSAGARLSRSGRILTIPRE
jgi:hypothetical protein